MNKKIGVFIKRFLKGFIAAGIVSVIAQLQQGVVIAGEGDLKKLGFSLAIAFFTGGLMAIEKMITWTDAKPVQ